MMAADDREDRLITRSAITAPDSSLSTIKRATRTLPGLIFKQDNARPLKARARVAMNCLTVCQTPPWPARLSDLSPIEHVWNMIGRQLHLPGNVDDLARQLEQIW
ncbi:transposable element Tcb1 transposase [Trichonephila clavipes]|nr:transposable element Tcb1 transposase [Trichonephila clavipes]